MWVMGGNYKPDDATIQILIREHERLSQLYNENRQLGERRVTMYVSLLAVTVTVLGVLSKDKSDYWLKIESFGFAEFMIIAILTIPLIVGWVIFIRLIERRIEATILLRGINLIHGYFCKHNQDLYNYLFWKPTGRLPKFEPIHFGPIKEHLKFLRKGCKKSNNKDDGKSTLADKPGLVLIIQLLNSFYTGSIIVFMVYLCVKSNEWPIIWSLLIGLLSIIAAFIIQICIYNCFMKKARENKINNREWKNKWKPDYLHD